MLLSAQLDKRRSPGSGVLCDLPEAPQVGWGVTVFLRPPLGSGSVLAPQVMAEAELELLSRDVERAQVCRRVEA